MKLKPLFLITTALVGTVALAATVTPNMSLLTPSVGDSDYPVSISNSFSLIDLHDHSPGHGVPISPAGIPNSAITTAKIADGAVTAAKVDATLTQSFMPPGVLVAYGGASAPAGWLIADGSAVNKTGVYAALFAAIACNFGCTTTQFNLPDMRGRFMRGRDGGAGNDPDRTTRLASNPGGLAGDNVGSLEMDAMQKHKHTDAGHAHPITGGDDALFSNGGSGPPAQFRFGSVSTQTGYAALGDPTDSGSGGGTPRIANETRPQNLAVNYIIKY